MKPVGYCRGWYGRTPQSSRRLASSAQGTPFGCPKGEPYIQACKRHKNKVTHLHKQHLKKSTLPIQARATIGVGKPQADSEVRANSAGRFRHSCPRKCTSRRNPPPVRHTPRIFTRLPRQNDKKVQHPLALPAVLCYTIKAIPHKERLATLHAICLQISRHISQKI